ncbi:LysR family transcriptional regulator [Colwellia sp. MEBiC06753]
MIRVDLLNVFVTVSEEGSFTKASERLGMSNQLVSKYVAQLEEHLNTRLLNRTTRKVYVTEAGEKCIQYAKHILESVNEMEEQFGELQTEVKGTLNISAPVSFSTLHLANFLCEFKRQYPKIALNVQLNDRKVDVIEDGYDIALRIGQLKSSSLIAKKLAPVRLVVCASPDYIKANGMPKHPTELNPEHLLHYRYADFDKPDNELLKTFKLYSQTKRATMVANNGELLMAAAIAGEGYTLQPTFIVGEAIKQGKLQTMLEGFEPEAIGLYAVYPHRKLITSKVRAFIDTIDGFFGSPPYWDAF